MNPIGLGSNIYKDLYIYYFNTNLLWLPQLKTQNQRLAPLYLIYLRVAIIQAPLYPSTTIIKCSGAFPHICVSLSWIPSLWLSALIYLFYPFTCQDIKKNVLFTETAWFNRTHAQTSNKLHCQHKEKCTDLVDLTANYITNLATKNIVNGTNLKCTVYHGFSDLLLRGPHLTFIQD